MKFVIFVLPLALATELRKVAPGHHILSMADSKTRAPDIRAVAKPTSLKNRATSGLRKVADGHHILTIEAKNCPCSKGDDCPCTDGKKHFIKDDGAAGNDGYTDEIGVAEEYTAQAAAAATEEVDEILETTTTTTPVSPYASSPVMSPVTDQQLLIIYKGNDASDRVGVADYGDVLQDFRNGFKIWPDKQVLFLFDDNVSNCVKSTVNVAVAVINSHTCISFIEVPTTPPVELASNTVLHITDSGVGCFASLGWQAQENVVNIGSGCVNVGTALHLLLHSLGLFHEHQRFDRDNFVAVHTANIDQERIGGSLATTKFSTVFAKDVSNTTWSQNLGPYDYESIMHNGPCHYSVAEQFGECTAQPTLSGNDAIGNRDCMSAGDIAKVCGMYGCVAPDLTDHSVLADAKTAQTTLCTVADAADFAWSDIAFNGRPPVASVVGVAAATTVAPTSNPNEAAAFQDPLRASSDETIYIILVGGIIGVFLMVGTFMYLAHKNRAAKRTGRASRVRRRAATSNDRLSAVVRANEADVGEDTESDIYDELVAEGR